MKLARFGEPGKEKPGLILSDGTRIDASILGEDYDRSFFKTGGLNRLTNWITDNASTAPIVDDSVRLAPPYFGARKNNLCRSELCKACPGRRNGGS